MTFHVISGSEYQILVHKKDAEYCKLIETAANLFKNVYATRNHVDQVQTEVVADVECNRSPFETIEEFSEYIGQVSSIDKRNIHVIPGPYSGPLGFASSERVIITS